MEKLNSLEVKGIRKRRPIEWIENENGCWICTSHYIDTDGYPKGWYNGKKANLSHLVYEEAHGINIIGNKFVLHKCDNPLCINPTHLELGTHADNMHQMVERGRSNKGEKNGRAKLTSEEVKFIKENTTLLQRELAKMFGVSRPQISYIRTGKEWAHI